MLTLIEMSFTGAVLIAVIIIVRALLINRLPKKAFLLLWAAALARLILPFRISLPTSIYTAAGEELLSGRPGIILRTDGAAAANGTSASAGNITPLLTVWMIAALLLAALFLVTHLRSRQSYLSSLPLENSFVKRWLDTHRLRRPVQVRYSDRIGAPLTYGILWPVLLLPKSMDWEDEETLGYVLSHELSHIKRFDALTKWLLAAALCIHWFNPLVWAMYVLFNRDLELSCDEAVLRQYGPMSRSSYAMALVGMEERRGTPAPLSSGFSRQALKERITAIMSSRPLTLGSMLAAGALVIVTVCLFATSAPAKQTGGIRIDEGMHASGIGPDGGNEGEIPPSQTEAGLMPESSEALREAPLSSESTDNAQQMQENETSYTEEEYNRLLQALSFDGYQDMSIAEFNRKVHAAVQGDYERNGNLYFLYDKILSAIPVDDPYADYLVNTVQTSLNEYSARLDEVYSKKQHDPNFTGSAQVVREEDVFGEKIPTETRMAEYIFTYRILDQDSLSVRERDSFIQKILTSGQDILKQNQDLELTEEEYLSELKAAGSKASTDKIEFMDCEMIYLEAYNND